MTGMDLTPWLTTKIPLRFRPDGSFRILMVSDVHGGAGYNRTKTTAAMEALVDAEQPDLVLFGGDTAGPGVIHVETAEQLRSLLADLSEPMERRGIPWCHVFGNHDDNYGVPNEAAEGVYESFPCCVSKAGDPELSGVGNYVLPVTSTDGGEILLNIYGFDSHSGMSEFFARYGIDPETKLFPPFVGDHGSEDTLNMDQVVWYYGISKEFESACGRKIPAVMFMHIPIPEFELITKYRRDARLTGHHGEDVCFSPLNSGIFRACVERGDVKGIFCGHDHWNDFSGVYMGITLACDASMSYHACQDNNLRGGRVIDFRAEDPASFTTRTVKIRAIMGHAGDSDE
jgi:hypothetical protein